MKANATMRKIKDNIKHLKGNTVTFTERHGSKRVQFKGVLTELYDSHATITLDRDVHNYDSYTFSYIHIFMNEGYLQEWDKATDDNLHTTEFRVKEEQNDEENS